MTLTNTSHGKENKDSIKGKVIAGVASGLILAAIFYFVPRLFHWIARVFISIWNHLTASTHIPNWLLWLLVILSLITLVRRIRILLKRELNNEPTFRMYTQDFFEGMTWRWAYDVYDRLTDLSPYCPSCDALLVHIKEPYQLGGASSVRFYCESCKQERGEIKGGGRDYAEAMIGRFIDRKIRNGEWERVIKRDGLIGGDK